MTGTTDLALLKVTSLGKTFADRATGRWLFRDVGFSVAPGESVALLGASGCGKSTLLRILIGVEQPSEGSINIGVKSGRCGSAYIPQEPNLLPWRTLVQNACFGLELGPGECPDDKGELSRDDVARVVALIDDFGLMDKRHQITSTLSGGERQRTAVIRALAMRPRLLFCDEPFSAVDFVTRLELNRRFKRNLLGGISCLFVTHNIEEAIFLADRILILGGSPTHIVDTIDPVRLSSSPVDPVACRESPEFGEQFKRIWATLEEWRAR